ncbi:DUF2341 domain-containing protein [bacterium]|nr:DUF2341 domain-containing protein [bacterium]
MLRKTILIIMLVTFAASLAAPISLATNPIPMTEPWWDHDWTRRAEITVDNSSNSLVLSDFPVPLTLPYDSDMDNDLADLRFIADDHATALGYWIESYTGGSEATVWVRVPSIPANGTASVFAYYGNAAASSESNRSAYVEFEDDFSSDPNSTWDVYRYDSDTANEAVWDPSGWLALTTPTKIKAAAIFAPYDLTTNSWLLSFDYYIGGGTGADGISAMFYKDTSGYADGSFYYGGGMGFINRNHTSITGYGLEFDGHNNSNYNDTSAEHIAFIEHNVDTHLVYVDDGRVDDSAWHSVVVTWVDGAMDFYLDGGTSPLLSYTVASPDTSNTGFGFGAGTGGVTNYHSLDNILLRKWTDPMPVSSVGAEENHDTNIEETTWGQIKANL